METSDAAGGSMSEQDQGGPRHAGDYYDGDGFTYCQECIEATGDYALVADCPHRARVVPLASPAEGGEDVAAVLLAHRGWAETGPNDNGSWNLVCHTCGEHLLTMWGTYVSEDDRDELQAAHLAAALAPLIEQREREVAARAWDEGHRTRQRRGPDECRCYALCEGECGCGFYGTGPLVSLQENPYREGWRP